jgi:hypothetical protein
VGVWAERVLFAGQIWLAANLVGLVGRRRGEECSSTPPNFFYIFNLS